MKCNPFLLLSIFFTSMLFSQNLKLSVDNISFELKENANSVIRNQEVFIEIKSPFHMNIKTKKIVTVFNEKGLGNIDANEYYDKSKKIVSVEAVILNSFGSEIKKIKRKDFKDQSIADGFSIFSDDRVLTLSYVPTEYPFTVIYESEVNWSNTAFVPSWIPVDDYLESVQKSNITINYPKDLGFKYKEANIVNRNIKKSESSNSISYEIENQIAEKDEDYSISFLKKVPSVIFALNKFGLEGIQGDASTWQNFGIWMNNYLLKDVNELSDEAKTKIKTLVGSETDLIKKAKIVYQYVQDKTRYVSIQLGIGGWKPMKADDVDRLGYGDCKALSNYTKALLQAVGVDSYYAVIYGGIKRDMEEDFVSMQGNHVVLAIPYNEKFTFLECTDQSKPFGFEGDFTDDRFALLIKPNGGELVKTEDYIDRDNSQITKGEIFIQDDGKIEIKAVIKSKGIQYDNLYGIVSNSDEKIKEHYKSRFWYINNLNLDSYKFINNKEDVEFIEELKFRGTDYFKNANNEIVFSLNVLNLNTNIPQRYRNRKTDFEISRGYFDEDFLEIDLPKNYLISFKPENFELKTKFGFYKVEFTLENEHKIIYKRSLLINNGSFTKNEYDEFRSFKEQIAKYDNSKVILQKNIK